MQILQLTLAQLAPGAVVTLVAVADDPVPSVGDDGAPTSSSSTALLSTRARNDNDDDDAVGTSSGGRANIEYRLVDRVTDLAQLTATGFRRYTLRGAPGAQFGIASLVLAAGDYRDDLRGEAALSSERARKEMAVLALVSTGAALCCLSLCACVAFAIVRQRRQRRRRERELPTALFDTTELRSTRRVDESSSTTTLRSAARNDDDDGARGGSDDNDNGNNDTNNNDDGDDNDHDLHRRRTTNSRKGGARASGIVGWRLSSVSSSTVHADSPDGGLCEFA